VRRLLGIGEVALEHDVLAGPRNPK
jgi:hypothetical protein